MLFRVLMSIKNGMYMLPFHKSEGFVLLIVLVFIQIFSLLGLSAMNNVFLLLKTSNTLDIHSSYFHQSTVVLTIIESMVVHQIPDCVIPVTEPDVLIAKSLNWWQSYACSDTFSSLIYYYVVEPLAVDPCANIEHAGSSFADYYRITLFLFSRTGGARIFLQSSLVRPDTTSKGRCNGQKHVVRIGRQSWRELS